VMVTVCVLEEAATVEEEEIGRVGLLPARRAPSSSSRTNCWLSMDGDVAAVDTSGGINAAAYTSQWFSGRNLILSTPRCQCI
jgi:hypothetical protein